MKYYLAPMEGITGYVFRAAVRDHFRVPDKCFTPFIAPNQNRCMNTREKKDVLPEHNRGLYVVPQILTNKAEDFIRTCGELKGLGYSEVNLNLGCPSGTVVAKKRGSGFLAVPSELDKFLEQIFEKAEVSISIKTRLGIETAEEFYELLDIYEKYPIHELIIHPRVQKDFYKNAPHMEVFGEALKRSRHDICYNGDLFTMQDMEAFRQTFPTVEKVMLGRGMVVNPGLLDMSVDGKAVTKEQLKAFHDRLLADYGEELSGDKNLLFKMKELWFYMIRLFADSEKEAKKIKKAQRLWEYKEVVERLFAEHELVFSEKLYF